MFACLAVARARASTKGHPKDLEWFRPSGRVTRILEFWRDQLSTWNRRCRIVAAFSPVAQHQNLGHTDAATIKAHGWGAILVRAEGPILGAGAQWTDAERTSAFKVDRESTGELEMCGIAYWLATFGQQCSHTRVLLLCMHMHGEGVL